MVRVVAATAVATTLVIPMFCAVLMVDMCGMLHRVLSQVSSLCHAVPFAPYLA